MECQPRVLNTAQVVMITPTMGHPRFTNLSRCFFFFATWISTKTGGSRDMTRWLKKHFFQIFNSIWGTWTHFDLWKYWLYPFHGTDKLLKMQKITCKNHRILYGSFKHLRYVGGFATKLQKNGLVIMNWHTFFFFTWKKMVPHWNPS